MIFIKKEIATTNKLEKILKFWTPIIISIMICIFLKTMVFTLVSVDGKSMYPTYSGNEILFVTKLDKTYTKGDIVIFDSFDEQNREYIKRVIGCPNDHLTINNGYVYVNNEKIQEDYLEKKGTTSGNIDLIVPEGEYFVLGDNRRNSSDSRILGTIKKENIKGKVSTTVFKKK